ncbi:L-histidine N(alpha)-methyltransferase [Streptomyces sp. NBC_01450]|uniref:L-histidine N(alpha)-methyltransferase n=1 Tax=Streptomyces sp. NBC_01450 TaxID=2903871 RepID=UPI003FCEC8A1
MSDALGPPGLHHVPVDVSEDSLHQASAYLVQECPQLIFHALRADFTALPGPPELPASNPWLIAFIGSTLGNLPRPVHTPYLRELRSIMRPADFLLTGADLVKALSVKVDRVRHTG